MAGSGASPSSLSQSRSQMSDRPQGAANRAKHSARFYMAYHSCQSLTQCLCIHLVCCALDCALLSSLCVAV